MPVPVIDRSQILEAIEAKRRQWGRSCLAFYSSWLGGVSTDSEWLLIPVDDHVVHRGDGVFEALRVIDWHLFDARAHLERLEMSAASIGLKSPFNQAQWMELCGATAHAADCSNLMLRIFLSRGPGGFSPNPYESREPLVHIVAMEFKPVPDALYEQGARAILSRYRAKDQAFARIKSCNYLPNVLMKKEAVDAGVEFSIALDAQGRLTEGPTENLIFLDARGELCVPHFDYTLKGTTLLVLLEEINRGNVEEIAGVRLGDFSIEDLRGAQEAAMVGTTLEVLPLTQMDGRPVGAGKVGPVMRRLRQALRGQMQPGRPRMSRVDRSGAVDTSC